MELTCTQTLSLYTYTSEPIHRSDNAKYSDYVDNHKLYMWLRKARPSLPGRDWFKQIHLDCIGQHQTLSVEGNLRLKRAHRPICRGVSGEYGHHKVILCPPEFEGRCHTWFPLPPPYAICYQRLSGSRQPEFFPTVSELYQSLEVSNYWYTWSNN